MKNLDKVIAKVAIPTLAVAAVLLVLLITVSARDFSKSNNGYIRVINCVISTPANIRTQADIENCYTTVEKDLGIHLQRYDTGAYKQ